VREPFRQLPGNRRPIPRKPIKKTSLTTESSVRAAGRISPLSSFSCVRGQSGAVAPHSKTLRVQGALSFRRQVLECSTALRCSPTICSVCPTAPLSNTGKLDKGEMHPASFA
jgi:hypothetical protein